MKHARTGVGADEGAAWFWGIGLAAESEFAGVPQRWKGLNLLGFALMEARQQLSGE